LYQFYQFDYGIKCEALERSEELGFAFGVASSEVIPTWMYLRKCLFLSYVNRRVVCNQFEIKVKVKDSGIAQKILDKIFQPFFTTKPTGQGTGFGLSLATISSKHMAVK